MINKKIYILLITLLCLACMTACKAAKEGKEEVNAYTQISMEEAMELMETEENYIILDVRTLEEYQAGHIPGAIVVPNETIGTNEISELPDKEQMILVYCRSGNRSKQASEKLVKLGYTNVLEFGGIIDWPGEIEYGSRD